MNNTSLVSIVVTTKNSEKFLEKCLNSIKNQNYKYTEIIVIDNNSIDSTKKIARRYTNLVYNKGPERSPQRNYGAKKAAGKYLLFVDADMVLDKKIVKEGVKKLEGSDIIGALIIPEKSFGEGFWAKCKELEKEFYLGVEWIEAARFYKGRAFNSVDGFDEEMISGEDWDLSQRVKEKYEIKRIGSYISHNEGKLSLMSTISKKYYYAQKLKRYVLKNSKNKNFVKQVSIFERFKLYFSNPKKLFKNPIVGIGMLFMKASEFLFVGIGYKLS